MRWLATLMRRSSGTSAFEVDETALFKALVTPDAYPGYHEALAGAPVEPAGFVLTAVLEGIAAIADGRAPLVSVPSPVPETVRKDRKVREAGARRRERERELMHAVREEQRAIRDAKRELDGRSSQTCP